MSALAELALSGAGAIAEAPPLSPHRGDQGRVGCPPSRAAGSHVLAEVSCITLSDQKIQTTTTDLYCVEWGVKLYSLTHSLACLHVFNLARIHAN